MISFSNDISVAGNGVYLMGFTPGQSIDRVVEYARERGLERFGALAPEGVYGRRASQAMVEAVEGAGGRLVAHAELRSRARRACGPPSARLNGAGRL